jgi:hypothetical protein
VRTEGLVLDARAGCFIPNGNGDRSHRDATLLRLLVAGASNEGVMVKSGHECVKRLQTLCIAARMPSRKFFVLVKIA